MLICVCSKDRTEAQARAALHAHILCWFRRRKKPEGYTPIRPLPRKAPGTEQRQRPLDQEPEKLDEFQEDGVYHDAHVARVVGELVRPEIKPGGNWSGWDTQKMRIAFLARAVQTRLPYIHNCSAMYCLKNRSNCRFFFPSRP